MAAKVYDQLDSAADWYDPSTYDLLTFHNSMFERESDPLAASYYPMTAARLSYRQEIIPFVVGVLPPASFIKDSLLDRSGDLGGSDAYESFVEDPDASGFQEPETPETVAVTRTGAKKHLVAGKVTRLSGDDAYFALNAAYRAKHGKDIPENVWPILLAQWSCETGYGKSQYNYNFAGIKGYGPTGQGTRKSTKEGYGETEVRIKDVFRAYDSAEQAAGDYIRLLETKFPEAWKAALRGDTDGYVAGLVKRHYFTGDPEVYRGWIRDRTAKARSKGPNILSGYPGSPETKIPSKKGSSRGAVRADVNGGKAFARSGSRAASAAQRGAAAGEKKTYTFSDPNQTAKGKEYQVRQRATIEALKIAQQQMAQTPPLQLVISPQSFSVSSSKIISDGNWGRNGAGVGIEHWGDGQDTISATGRVAGFYAVDYDPSRSNGGGPGLTRMARAFSTSYQNLLSLYLIYRNNGALWLEDFADARGAATTKPNNLTMVGSVYIYYDNTLYIGSFNSFEITEEAEAPFTLSYTFEFVARQTYLLDRDGVMTADGGVEFGYPPATSPVAGPTQKDDRYAVWTPPTANGIPYTTVTDGTGGTDAADE